MNDATTVYVSVTTYNDAEPSVAIHSTLDAVKKYAWENAKEFGDGPGSDRFFHAPEWDYYHVFRCEPDAASGKMMNYRELALDNDEWRAIQAQQLGLKPDNRKRVLSEINWVLARLADGHYEDDEGDPAERIARLLAGVYPEISMSFEMVGTLLIALGFERTAGPVRANGRVETNPEQLDRTSK